MIIEFIHEYDHCQYYQGHSDIFDEELKHCIPVAVPFSYWVNEEGLTGIVHETLGELKTRIIETAGHTPGSITTLVDTDEGLVAIVGDAVIVKEDLLGLQAPSVVTMNVREEEAIASLQKIRALNAVTVIPDHDAPFCPQDLKQPDR